MYCVKRKSNITQWLNKYKGGHWKYDRKIFTWTCDDNIRYVHKVGNIDENDNIINISYCMYYSDSRQRPEWIYPY